ncbi:hypothetical protein L7F22_023914 [Adiantum nelumboides]|nr:hypothetical protein [Adiantum nelumboides]
MKGDTKPHKGAYSGVVSGLVKMWQEEGFKGFMRGNGINCLRIAPYSAVQFSSYEILKNYLKDKDGELDVPRRLTAGALAGIASVVSTYPLDLVRSRISIASASLYADAKAATGSLSEPPVDSKPKRKPSRAEVRRIIEERQKKVPGIWAMTVKVYREEGGIRALYKGCVPTSAGVAPYVAINFAAYEALRKRLANEDGEISTVRKLSCGALAGSISQTLTYPLDVLRRRMQVSGMKDSKLGYSDKSECSTTCIQHTPFERVDVAFCRLFCGHPYDCDERGILWAVPWHCSQPSQGRTLHRDVVCHVRICSAARASSSAPPPPRQLERNEQRKRAFEASLSNSLIWS